MPSGSPSSPTADPAEPSQIGSDDEGRTGPAAPTRLPRTVALIGLMGAGKSVIGRRLAACVKVPFIDADSEIEKAAQCSIAEIFERFGEAAFREGETKVITRLLTGPPCILATGGGAFMSEETRANISAHAVSLWLRADLETLVHRTAGRSHRPLLNGAESPRTVLDRLMQLRYPVYAQADVVVDVCNEPPDVTCTRVRTALEDFLGMSLLPCPPSPPQTES